ncbi:hypothetical protein CEXT_736131 [Caerostris extrusa]|uniref:Uncharacterized protein n=1 Tax=Caerostris extrusa TaxID=172846 RepID=A0AAV4N058_CAEEX|nr:hypothetical protein CEXT_736131 [Caerostris extrusa]
MRADGKMPTRLYCRRKLAHTPILLASARISTKYYLRSTFRGLNCHSMLSDTRLCFFFLIHVSPEKQFMGIDPPGTIKMSSPLRDVLDSIGIDLYSCYIAVSWQGNANSGTAFMTLIRH